MKTSPQVSNGSKPKATDKTADPHAHQHKRTLQDESTPLPHETDQSPESQHEDDPRGVGKQAHRDLERGLEDTDRRGGDAYQERTQNDAHTNANAGDSSDEAKGKAKRGGTH